jgi:carboxymethylenebutenolidase
MGEMITYPANGHEGTGYLARPENGKAVIVIQEWNGLNEHIKDLADRFAGQGYIALAPDHYHGVIAAEPDEAGKMFMALNISETEQELRGGIDMLHAETGNPVGVTGFCMGGALALFAACQNSNKVGACVDFYGIHPNVEYDWDSLTAPVLGLWAEHDDMVNPQLTGFAEALASRQHNFHFKTYPGTAHAFFNDTNTEGHDVEASADAWELTLEWFARYL